jgi:hypothetical protein
MDAPGEIWQVMVNGEVYEADLDTVKQWIVEGAVQPQDKVRRGKLNWLDAGRVPALRSAFGGADMRSEPPHSYPPLSTPPSYGGTPYDGGHSQGFGDLNQPTYDAAPAGPSYGSAPTYGASTGTSFTQPHLGHGVLLCSNHHSVPATHGCQSCGAGFCKSCRKIVNNITLCSLCGSFCRPVEELKQQTVRALDKDSGFGLNDLGRAIMYPLSNPVGLVIMTFIYGLLLFAGWRGQLLAIALTLSCMSTAINRLSMGRYEEGYLPDIAGGIFDIFISPLKLAVAIALIAYGPLILAFYLGADAILSIAAGGMAGVQLGAALILFFAGLLWSAFYYPMALLVAGFTQSFVATINPLVGFDTIWRLGFDYVKAYGMCLVAGAIQIALHFLFLPLTVTDNRSIPAAAMVFVGMILQGGSAFYTYMIVAAILGLALYKCADKLDLGLGDR